MDFSFLELFFFFPLAWQPICMFSEKGCVSLLGCAFNASDTISQVSELNITEYRFGFLRHKHLKIKGAGLN